MCFSSANELHVRICKLEQIIIQLANWTHFNISPEVYPHWLLNPTEESVSEEPNFGDGSREINDESGNPATINPSDVELKHTTTEDEDEWVNEIINTDYATNFENYSSEVEDTGSIEIRNEYKEYPEEENLSGRENVNAILRNFLLERAEVVQVAENVENNDSIPPQLDSLVVEADTGLIPDVAQDDFVYKIDVDDSSEIKNQETGCNTPEETQSESDNDPTFCPSDDSDTSRSEITAVKRTRSRKFDKVKTTTAHSVYEPLHVPSKADLHPIPHVLLKPIDLTKFKLHKCPQCPQNFHFGSQLNFHLQNVHPKKHRGTTTLPIVDSCLMKNQKVLLNCAFCSYSSSNYITLRNHLTSQHPAEYSPVRKISRSWNNKCPYCIYSAPGPGGLKRHLIAMHSPKEQRPFRCSICPMTFKFADDATKHVKRHSSERAILCHLCPRRLRNKGELTEHIKKKHTKLDELNLPVCYFCGIKRHSNSSLFSHMTIHTGERPAKCKKCPYATIAEENLQRHVNDMHPKDPLKSGRKLSCPLCKCMFKVQWSLNFHLNKNHSKVKGMLKCNLCDYTAINSGFLKIHVHKHHPKGGLNYECYFCKNKFKIPELMEIHTRVHTGEKPFKCRKCEYASSSHVNLGKHKQLCRNKAGSQRMIYTCDGCGQKFSNEGNVKRHKSKCHLEEGVIKCKKCNYIFRDEVKFKRHMQNKHGIRKKQDF